MQERKSRFEVGQTVEWKGVRPYSISLLVGRAGLIHISETGRYHVYWHRQSSRGQRLLVHHGGPEGFADLNAVKRQHERVILRFVGIKVEIPPEQEDPTPEPNQTFPELARGFNQLVIPGEQQVVSQWINVLSGVSRDLPQATSHAKLTDIRENLQALLGGPLGRSINRYKLAAASTLETGIQRGRINLADISEAQKQLLLRTQESVSITLGTMERYNALERLQLYWNDIVNNAPYTTARAARIFQSGEVQDDQDRRAIVEIVSSQYSLVRKLAELKGEPYLSRAQKAIKALSGINDPLDRRNHTLVARLLLEQTAELEIWKRSIREQYVGVNFGKYALE